MTTVPLSPTTRPAWMRRADQRADRVLVLALVIGLLSALGFVISPALPASGSLERYAFRIENDAQALLEGRLYPRWTANTFGGYGAPIPSFTPPLPSFGPAILHAMLVADAADALRLFAVIVLTGGSISTYLWVRDRAGRRAGLLAAALIATSPWLAYSMPYVLGSVDLMLIAALAPAWWWLAGRMHSPSTWALAGGAAALLMLSEPRLALLVFALTPLLLPLRSRWPQIALAALAGVGLSAFAWFPALVEAPLVRWIAPQPPLYAVLTPSSILRAAEAAETGWFNPPPQPALGLPLLAALVLLAGAALWSQRSPAFGLRALAAAAALLIATLALIDAADSRGVFTLAVIVLCAAGGCAALALPRQRSERWYAAALALALLLNLPMWPGPPAHEQPYTVSAEVEYEQRGFGIAVTPLDHYAVTVLAEQAAPDQTMLTGLRSGEIIKTSTVSNDVTVGILQHDTHQDRLQVDALSPFELRVLTAAFDGWTARFNDQPLFLSSDVDGLIRLSVPAGNGELVLRLESTPVRAAGWLIAWLSLASCLLILRRLAFSASATFGAPADHEPWRLPAAGCVLAVVIAAAVMLAARTYPPGPGAAPPAGWRTIEASPQPGLTLEAVQPFRAQAAPGEMLLVRSSWRAALAQEASIAIRLVVLDADGVPVVSTSAVAPGGIASTRWPAGMPVLDQRALQLPDTLAPGSYRIALEALLCASRCEGRPLPWVTSGTSQQQLILPGTLTVTSDSRL
jgi:hypothetical protein